MRISLVHDVIDADLGRHAPALVHLALVPAQQWIEAQLGTRVSDLVGPEHNREAAETLSIANAFNSLRAITRMDFTEFFENLNVGITKRMSHGWAGRFSYAYSVLKDNQFGESNFYSGRNLNPMNNYNYDSTLPACAAGMARIDAYNAKCFDPMVDYAYGILDVPHRFIASPIFELPFGRGKAIGGKSDWSNLLVGGWIASAVIIAQSGFPIGMVQSNSNSNLLGNGQRPNLASAVDLATSGSLADRLASADHPSATWFNPAAFTPAAAGTWGNAPRTVTDARTPRIVNTDVAVQKNVGLGGGKQAQIRLEIFNLFNRPQLAGFSTAQVTQGNSNFGQMTSQGGFMRMTQVSFRLSW